MVGYEAYVHPSTGQNCVPYHAGDILACICPPACGWGLAACWRGSARIILLPAWLAVGDRGYLGQVPGVVVGIVEPEQVLGQGGDLHGGREAAGLEAFFI